MLSTKRSGRIQRATAIVPLALLSAALTANLVGVSATSPVSASAPTQSQTDTSSLPNGVPEQAIEAPATVSSPDSIGSTFDGAPGDAEQIVSSSSANGIPSAALAAYQRAESVINAADKSCNLSWQLVAAIGRVESNHGRFGGNTLDDQGVARPGIYGPILDGKGATSRIVDTDAGRYDDLTNGPEKNFDRAVGPMQFIPSTWSVVGVDADNDGERNPQDIDDAALGTAVYLCSGKDDLGTTAGQKSSVYRYNHSNSYVDLVLRIMDAYLQGDYTSVPNGTTSAGTLTEAAPPLSTGPINSAAAQQTPVGLAPPVETTPPSDEPSTPAEPTTPSADGDKGNGNGNDNDNKNDNKNDGPIPGIPAVQLPAVPVKVPKLPPTTIKPVDDLLTRVQAEVQCRLDGFTLVFTPDKFKQCVTDYTTKGAPERK